MRPDDIRWSQMKPDEARWALMTSDEARGGQRGPDEARWFLMSSDEPRWGQMTSDEARWPQMRPRQCSTTVMAELTPSWNNQTQEAELKPSCNSYMPQAEHIPGIPGISKSQLQKSLFLSGFPGFPGFFKPSLTNLHGLKIPRKQFKTTVFLVLESKKNKEFLSSASWFQGVPKLVFYGLDGQKQLKFWNFKWA